MQFAADMKNFSPTADLPKPAVIRGGDHSAFLEAYNLLHNRVFHFYLRRVYLLDTAKDLTQQCFIRLWQFRQTLSDEHALDKQVFIIARTLLINHLKKEATRRKLLVPSEEALAAGMVESPAARLEVTDEVSAALESLPPVRRKVIMLKAIYGCSNKEIASEMRISVKTVEDHVSKAFRRIRQLGITVLVLWLGNLH
ncbi:RNA polymerase sigma factor [Puia sp. P3]|uniref:RNA polymerase sigma factor n=1 Tax=Puia sp. P3 TaxID=3423952 RepID=UPI003D67E4D7